MHLLLFLLSKWFSICFNLLFPGRKDEAITQRLEIKIPCKLHSWLYSSATATHDSVINILPSRKELKSDFVDRGAQQSKQQEFLKDNKFGAINYWMAFFRVVEHRAACTFIKKTNWMKRFSYLYICWWNSQRWKIGERYKQHSKVLGLE